MLIQVNTDNHTEGSAELTRQVESIVEGALGHFGNRITRVEVHLSDENSSRKFGDDDKRCAMEARLAGLRPITVSHLGSTLEQALAGAADTLERTLKRTLRRKDYLSKRRTRARDEFTTADPLLQRGAEGGNQEDFMTLLRPLLGHLRDHAKRELRILEVNGLLLSDQVNSTDLLNEVMTRAWLRFDDRPRRLSLELWLLSLLDETLDEKIASKPGAKKSLDQHVDEMHTEDVPQVDDQEWWAWLLGEDDSISLGDAITNGENAEEAEQLEARELKDRIHVLLGELPKARRQAFVLNVLEAFDPFEIAMLQDRPEKEVLADIEDVRNAFREQLPAGSSSQESASPSAAAADPKGKD